MSDMLANLSILRDVFTELEMEFVRLKQQVAISTAQLAAAEATRREIVNSGRLEASSLLQHAQDQVKALQ